MLPRRHREGVDVVLLPVDALKPVSGADDGMPPGSLEVWRSAYLAAETMGCSYPEHAAGGSVRIRLHENSAVTEGMVNVAMKATIANCGACFGHCSVAKGSTWLVYAEEHVAIDPTTQVFDHEER